MHQEIREMLKLYDHYFTRAYRYRYWLVVVDNHFDGVYSIFLYTQKLKSRLVHSYELLMFSNEDDNYRLVMTALKKHSKLTIEYRDTRHLIHPGTSVVQDTIHGHSSHNQIQKK